MKIHAIVRYNETLFPVEVRIEGLEVSEGRGYLYGDAEYGTRIFLNKVVERGYLPCIKPRKIKTKGYGARIRDRVFDREKYRRRGICEGFFGALTNWFGDKIPCFLRETTITRVLIRVACYALKFC